jgi:hypothetical protein
LSRFLAALLAFTIGAGALAGPAETSLTVDLSDPAALVRLERSNPEHYRKIRQILAGLIEQPDRAESDWLQTKFGASDVELSRYLFKTSYPPKQMLRFRLDDVRYAMHITRSDMVARPVALK